MAYISYLLIGAGHLAHTGLKHQLSKKLLVKAQENPRQNQKLNFMKGTVSEYAWIGMIPPRGPSIEASLFSADGRELEFRPQWGAGVQGAEP